MSNLATIMNMAGSSGLSVSNLFSTYLYEGNGSTQTITNGIDLAGEGGLVWIKNREAAYHHHWYDTERGIYKYLQSSSTAAEISETDTLTSFNSDGFSLSSDIDVNRSAQGNASWTFRKAPKFFDIVTYSGNGTAGRTISHNLGSRPGMIIVKRTDTTGYWPLYHRGVYSFDSDGALQINNTAPSTSFAGGAYFGTGSGNVVQPTDSVFTVGSDYNTNASGGSYVAYLFAHNNGDADFGPTGDQDIIKCGSFTSGSSGEVEVDLGFEPQWILIKGIDIAQDWTIVDKKRGWESGNNQQVLFPNKNNAETASSQNLVNSTPTGFENYLTYLGGGNSYLYVAIRAA